MQATPEVRALQELLAEATGAVEKHLVYLLQAPELFGRAYGQYIGTRTNDLSIFSGVTHWRNQPERWTSNRQWGKTEFEPVADAIDAIFKERGLLK